MPEIVRLQARDSGKLYSFKGKLRQDKDRINQEEAFDRLEGGEEPKTTPAKGIKQKHR
ncbi:hypothetical protein BY996DRAFT_6546737 [Phakopsora pachyrhizi]|nr:hypothetical protein BY996DRAFT_6546737 [Phakopsora pachyrhizi]